MATKRKGISKKLRFEVFKRDKFTCQYCGAKAPDVVLHCDHVSPVAEGGKTTALNLVTACEGCNLGKGPRTLSDDTALAKQRAELDRLAERREQIEMMLQWQQTISDIKGYEFEKFTELWAEKASPFNLNDRGREDARKLLRNFAFQDLVQALHVAFDNYVKYDDDGKPTHESIETAWQKIPGIARLSKLPPDRRRIYYIRGILRNRFAYVDQGEALALMERALLLGFSTEELEHIAKTERNWTNWKNAILTKIAIEEGTDASA